MELLAIIQALTILKEPCDVALYSDSEYVVKAMNERWPYLWRSRGWHLRGKKEVANLDLWVNLLALCETHNVQFYWVKGHAGCPENERCDKLAVQAAHSTDLGVDAAYEVNKPSDR